MAKKNVDNCNALKEYCFQITRSINRWKDINQNGCNDPFWTDGSNMNLVRNHIIYYKGKIAEIVNEMSAPMPEEYYLPLPPEVDRAYMANMKQEDRVKRILQSGSKITTKKPKYDEAQLSLF